MILNLLSHIATQSTCTLNGQATSCGNVTKAVGGIFGIFFLIFIFITIFSIIHLIFWIISLIHVIQHEDIKDRTVWIIVILLLPLGAIVYFFAVYLPYGKTHKAQVYAQAGSPQTPPYTAPAPPAVPPTPPQPEVTPPSQPHDNINGGGLNPPTL
ncbi:MAG: PLDc N-terminal domain-containing protein [Candidatus Saccharimonadales bacterium]